MTRKDDIEKRAPRWKRAVDAVERGDTAGGLFQFKSLAREGSLSALVEIGNLYENGGKAMKPDYQEAKKWYLRAVGAANDIEAYLGLARLYYLGRGVKKDYEKAYQYYASLESEEHPVVFLMLGLMHFRGEGVPRDIECASHFLERSAAMGNLIARRQLTLLSIRRGKVISGLLAWIRAVWAIMRVASTDMRDERVRWI